MRQVTLVLILVVVTIFTATSCKGKIFGSPVPTQPGEYIHNGSTWVRVQNEPIPDYWGKIAITDFDNAAIHISGKSFKWAQRFTPSDRQIMSSGLGALAAMGIAMTQVWALEVVDGNLNNVDEDEGGNVGPTKDESDYQAGYTLFEFSNLPPSPSGRYYLSCGMLGMDSVICLDTR